MLNRKFQKIKIFSVKFGSVHYFQTYQIDAEQYEIEKPAFL